MLTHTKALSKTLLNRFFFSKPRAETSFKCRFKNPGGLQNTQVVGFNINININHNHKWK